MQEKQRKREEEFIKELEETEKIKRQKENEDQDFGNWALRIIKVMQADGKNIKPLLQEFKSYKKKELL